MANLELFDRTRGSGLNQDTVSRKWYRRRRYQVGLGLFGLLGLVSNLADPDQESGLPDGLAMVETSISDHDLTEATPPTQAEPEIQNGVGNQDLGEKFSDGDWEGELVEIANSDVSKNKKYDQVMNLASNHRMEGSDLTEAFKYLEREFVSGNYISALLQDEQYALRNIFLARVIDLSIEDDVASSVDGFAFDFLQNSKYIYRGVDAPDSAPVKANEEQMRRALAEME